MKVVICTRDSTKVPKGFSIFEEVSKYLIFFNCRTKDEDSELIVGHAKAKVSIRKVQSAVKANQKMADRGGGIKMGSQSALQVPRSKGKSSNCRWLCFKSVQELSFRKHPQKYLDPKENRQIANVLFMLQRSGGAVYMYLGPRKGKFFKF